MDTPVITSSRWDGGEIFGNPAREFSSILPESKGFRFLQMAGFLGPHRVLTSVTPVPRGNHRV